MRRIALVFIATLLSACGSSDGGPAGTTGSVLVSVSPTTLSLEQGSGGSLSVRLTRTGGFTGAVRLSVAGLPTGITATITPTDLTGSDATATVAVIVAAAVPAQTYTVTITATATGVAPVAITLPLTVRGPSDIAYQYCGQGSAPEFLAYQDGTAAWQVVQPKLVNGMPTFSFRLTQPRGGVIAVYRSEALELARARTGRRADLERHDLLRTLGGGANPSGTVVASARASARSSNEGTWFTEVTYASATELAQDASENCARTTWRMATAVVSGVGAGQYGILSLGPANELFIGGESTNPVTFVGFPSGAVDFVGARLPKPGSPPDRLVVMRNLDIPNAGSLPAIDFNGVTSLPATATATIVGGNGHALEMYSEVVTARSGRALLWFDLAPSQVATRPWACLAPATMVSGDFHSVVVFATSVNDDFRVALKYVEQVSNQTLTLGSVLTAPTTTAVASGAYPRLRFQGTLPADYHKGVEIGLTSRSDAGNAFTFVATAAYLASSGDALRYDLTMPDVTSLPGFPGASRATAGLSDITVDAFGFNGPGIFDLTPKLGAEYKAATIGSMFAVP
jgi:hypothetical protein